MPDLPPPDDGGPAQHVLRDNISIDLRTVVSLAVVAGTGSKTVGDPGLYALTESGEIVPVSFVTESDGSVTSYPEPPIQRIYPTPAWILFATWGWNAPVADGDGGTTSVPCSTLATHRDTGALFCSALGIRDAGPWTDSSPQAATVVANLAGDVVYVTSADSLDRNVLYRLDLDPDAGPTATLVPDVVGLQWSVVNASGDLFVAYKPSTYDPASTFAIHPVDGSTPSIMEGLGAFSDLGYGTAAAAGEPRSAHQDTFYVLDAAREDTLPPYRVLHIVTRDGDTFTAVPHTLTLEDPDLMHVGHCGSPHRLADGIHLLCGGFGLALVVQDGAVIESPTIVHFTDLERTLDVGGLPFRFAPQIIALFGTDGTNLKFIRHDGLAQQDIPIDAAYELHGFGLSPGGAIDFLALDTTSGSLLRGTVPADSTEVTLLSAEEIDLAETVSFTRIN